MSGKPTFVFSDEDLAEMESLYRRGWTSTRLAKKYGCSAGTICRHLGLRGVARRPIGNRGSTWCLTHYGYVKYHRTLLHRIVAGAWRGEPLQSEEVVHHKDGNKLNNHPDNLEILPSHREHGRLHNRRWTPEKLELVREMVAQGLKSREIAAVLGSTRGAVANQRQRLVRGAK